MDIQGYVTEIRALYGSGQTTEHSFRPSLARLFASIDGDVTVINEPKRKTDVGAPDFVFNRNGIAIGWCEAKDIGKDVRKFAANDYSKEQKGRYTKGLPNLIYTNGLDFEFIRDGHAVAFVTIADLIPTMPARPADFHTLAGLLKEFVTVTPASITTAEHLAQMMAGKAAIIKDIMGRALVADVAANDQTELAGQYEAFRASLIHDITLADFADIYAETVAYGLFAARLHDTSPDTFTRTEALELLPKSNPFLRSLFDYIAGVNLDERIRWVIDELCGVFLAANLPKILKNFGKFTGRRDPFLHFYETFLAAYNPAKRKARGVWYTPEPVVNFIVRAVDEVLKTEFGLADGLADTSRITIDWDTGQLDNKGKPATIKKAVHRVQILDPATGTGTFLAEVVKLVAGRVKGIAPGQLSAYVEQELIPRLHGFELLMASYAMCHMKLDMILTELGYRPSAKPPRLGVYLTNSLEEGERVDQTLFGLSRAIANEAKAASDIKRQTPIMCVIGNPPYSGISHNSGKWITDKIEDYKYVDGVHFGERKHWLQDDYVKFIRLAEHMIEQNGEGVLGFITNHGYLDNPTFRGMRWHLLNTFDKIYVLDLHGNANKRETCPDGSPDKNVFDIMQGVAILISVKRKTTGKQSKALAEVRHGELWGGRDEKYTALWDKSSDVIPTKIPNKGPQYAFIPRSYKSEGAYNSGILLSDIFVKNVTGIVTARDSFVIDFSPQDLQSRLARFVDLSKSDERVRSDFFPSKKSGKYAPGDSRGWKMPVARQALQSSDWTADIRPLAYRPFDKRAIIYRPDMVDWGRFEHMRHMIMGPNIALLTTKAHRDDAFAHASLCEEISEVIGLSPRSASNSINFPLYLYPEEGALDQSIRLNFDPKLYSKIRKAAGLTGPLITPDGTDAFRTATGDARPDEVKVFDYIYGLLHSPAYRETYREFLKVDFPRVPFPRDAKSFAHISAKGEALRRLHLMEDAAIGATPFPFEGDGDSIVEKPRNEGDKVWINATQGFAGVSSSAWEFHIGGYQPAQKWLKDRKGRALSYDDIRHYQRIIKILGETDRIMSEIELPLD